MKNGPPNLLASFILLAASGQSCAPPPQPPLPVKSLQPPQPAGTASTNAQQQRWLEPTGNAELDELRRLAVQAPIDELMIRAPVFLDLMHKDYGDDRALWYGAERIAEEILSNNNIRRRRVQARWLAQVIEGADPSVTVALRSRVAELRRVP